MKKIKPGMPVRKLLLAIALLYLLIAYKDITAGFWEGFHQKGITPAPSRYPDAGTVFPGPFSIYY